MNKHIFHVCALISVSFATPSYGMFCQILTKHRTPVRSHANNYATNQHNKRIAVSDHCFEKLQEADRYIPTLMRYCEIQLQTTEFQQKTGGRPSLILKQRINLAPDSLRYNFHQLFVGWHMPHVYVALDRHFEKLYQWTEQVNTADRIKRTLGGASFAECFKKEMEHVAYRFKQEIISQDSFNPIMSVRITGYTTEIIPHE